MKKTSKRKILVSLILGMLILSYSSSIVKAGYTNDISLDGKLDQSYEIAVSKDNYTAYYTNSEDKLFTFLYTEFPLENETIYFKANNSNYIKDISENYNGKFLNTTHLNHSIEIEMSQELGNTIEFEIVNITSIELIFIDKFEKPEVPQPPESFQLDVIARNPDTDGRIILNWEVSKGALSYEIYFSNESFNTIDNASLLTTLNYKTLEYEINEENGTYYYRVLSQNNEGKTLSNEVSVEIAIPPTPPPIPSEFELRTTAQNPEEDGKFILNWTDSDGADYYEVYYSKEMITDLDDPKVSLIEKTEDSDLIVDEYFPDGDYYFVVVAKNEAGIRMSNYLTINIEYKPEGFTSWTLVTILIFSWILFFLYVFYKKMNDKIYIKAYRQEAVIKENGIEKRRLSGLSRLGELVEEPVFNEEKRCYEFRIRELRSLKYINVYSLKTFEEYKANFLIDHYYFVYYLLDCVFFEKPLKEKDWYEKELGLSTQALIYKVISWFFNLTPSGIIFSPLIMIGLFYWLAPTTPFLPLVASLTGVISSTINYILQNYTHILDPLTKKKKETIKSEYYLAPLESPEEILNVYRVWAKQQINKKTADGSTKEEIIRLKDDPEEHPNLKEEDIDFKTVVGYEKLFKMKQDPTIEIEDFKQIDLEFRKKTPAEMRNSKRSYLTRNRELVEDIFRLQEQLNRVQKENRKITEQYHYAQETIDKKIREMSERIMKMKTKNRNTLKHIFEEVYGEIVSDKWDEVLENILKKIKQEKHVKLLEVLSNITKRLIKLQENGEESQINIEKMLKDAGINAKQLIASS